MNLLNSLKKNDLNEMQEILLKTDVDKETLNKALLSACYRNNVKAVEIMIEAGANVNYECNLGTPLTEALEENNLEIAKILLKAGAFPCIPLYSEVSLPLMIAAGKGNLEIVKILIKFGANVNQIHQSTGSFALNCAAGAGHEDIFNYLAPLSDPKLRKEAKKILTMGIYYRQLQENVDSRVQELSDFVFDNNLKGVKEIIRKGVDVNGLDEIGSVALHTAVLRGNLEIVRTLLNAGANVHFTGDNKFERGTYSLSLSTKPEITKLLIDVGANVNFQDSDGITSLMIAAGCWGGFDNFQILTKAGADFTMRDKERKTALIYACDNDHNPEKVELLIQIGADVNVQDLKGKTPLMYAVEYRAVKTNIQKIKLLIKAGANINTKNNNENTALSLAKQAGNITIVKLLLESGAKEY